jgi:hypothetical protein
MYQKRGRSRIIVKESKEFVKNYNFWLLRNEVESGDMAKRVGEHL